MSSEVPVTEQKEGANIPEARNADGDTNAVVDANQGDVANVNVTELEATRRKLSDLRSLLENIGPSQHYTRKDVITCLKRTLSRDYCNALADEEDYEDNLPGYEISLKVLETVVPPFTGDSIMNVNQWLVNFEDLAAMCEWTNMQKVMYCRMLLRGSAQLFVNMDKCGFTWEELRLALATEFEDMSNTEIVRNVLAKRVKEPGETLREYFYKMCHMGVQGNIKADEMIQFIVNGLQAEEANKTVLKQAKTLSDLKRKLARFDGKQYGLEAKR